MDMQDIERCKNISNIHYTSKTSLKTFMETHTGLYQDTTEFPTR